MDGPFDCHNLNDRTLIGCFSSKDLEGGNVSAPFYLQAAQQ